jgi:hypothetical protein
MRRRTGSRKRGRARLNRAVRLRTKNGRFAKMGGSRKRKGKLKRKKSKKSSALVHTPITPTRKMPKAGSSKKKGKSVAGEMAEAFAFGAGGALIAGAAYYGYMGGRAMRKKMGWDKKKK